VRLCPSRAALSREGWDRPVADCDIVAAMITWRPREMTIAARFVMTTLTLLLCACTSPGSRISHPERTIPPGLGVVTGVTSPCGPVSGVTRPVTVLAMQDGRTIASMVAHYMPNGDRYQFELRPGTYTISAPLSRHPVIVVHVRAGRIVTANLPALCS